MKKSILLFLFIITTFMTVSAQTESGWNQKLNEVKFKSQTGEESVLGVDPGLRYANLQHHDRDFRLFYNRNDMRTKNIRIVDQKSGLEIAKGRGNIFWGNGRIEFIDGETVKLKRKRNQNGYTIIGPYGELFKIENQAISPVKTYGEKDFLSQAFFVFDWIKTTQKPPQDVVVYTTYNSTW
ncbi:MAG: hypothetical protein P8O16_14865 [Algoriphagus sp.]|uniref:hypothetical protein n=1 Tax=Algoriphagus sp. TaxID=1872435 RepID=UPI002603C9AE|nr:hypothetical protein [Algoriphagus sp.]MDG1278562.1 hypothetical protein [Algoriphagus sp.]